ncbi:MAG: hypothetical protein AAFP77_31770, partial [Bacteroidota bacterium]
MPYSDPHSRTWPKLHSDRHNNRKRSRRKEKEEERRRRRKKKKRELKFTVVIGNRKVRKESESKE